jgi:hypothetical protein
MMFTVHYMREEFFRDGNMGFDWLKQRGRLPNPKALEATHVLLKQEDARDLEDVFHKMQGEVWSPNGEARSLIREKGLQHTSMSVGDIAVDEAGKVWLVDRFGFKEVEQ